MTPIASAVGFASGSGTILDTSTALNVQAGDVLVAFASWAQSNGSASIAQTDAANPMLMMPDYSNYWSIYSRAGYVISAAAASSATFRFTITDAAVNRSITVLQYRPDANTTVHLHAAFAFGEGTGTAMATSALGLYGDDVDAVAFAVRGTNAGSFSNLAINGATPDGTISNASIARAMRLHFTENDTSVTASGTLDSSDDWYMTLLSFRSVSISGTAPSVRMYYRLWGPDGVYRTGLPTGGVLVSGWIKGVAPAGDYPRSRGNLPVFDLYSGNTVIFTITDNIIAPSANAGLTQFNANCMIGAVSPSGYCDDYTLLYENGATIPERDAVGWNFYAFQYILGGSSITVRQWVKPGRGQAIRYLSETISFTELRAGLVTHGWTQAAADAWSPSELTEIRIGASTGGSAETDCWYDVANYRVHARSTEPTIAEIDALSLSCDADTGAYADWQLTWDSGAVLTDRSGNSRPLSLNPDAVLYEGDPFDLYGTSEPSEITGTIASTASPGIASSTGNQPPYSDGVNILEYPGFACHASNLTYPTRDEPIVDTLMFGADRPGGGATGTIVATASPGESAAVGTSAAPGVSGTIQATASPGVAAIAGTVTPPQYTGTIAATASPGAAQASGTAAPPQYSGVIASVASSGQSSASGTTEPPEYSGTIAATATPGTASAAGTVTPPGITGQIAVAAAPGISAAIGTVVPPAISGAINSVAAPGVAESSGQSIPPEITGTIAATASAGVAASYGYIGELQLPPIERIIKIAAENRVIKIAAENRLIKVPAENRIIKIAAESRVVEV